MTLVDMAKPRCEPSLPDRFWANVEAANDGCWVWRAGRVGDGYGAFKLNGKQFRAHRLSYQALIGDIPDDKQLDHLCRNRACVRPDHLEIVDVRTNLLRGETIAATNASATNCPQGHPYDLFNTMFMRGRRYCRSCDRKSSRR